MIDYFVRPLSTSILPNEYVCVKSKFYKSPLVVLKVSNCVRVETFMKKDVIFLKSYLRSSFSKFKSTSRVAGFPRSQDKRAAISKKILAFFLYIPWLVCLPICTLVLQFLL